MAFAKAKGQADDALEQKHIHGLTTTTTTSTSTVPLPPLPLPLPPLQPHHGAVTPALIIADDIAICLDDGQMTEAEIAEIIEYEIAIREHEYEMYLDHMENVYGRNWRELEAESERNFRKSLGLEEG